MPCPRTARRGYGIFIPAARNGMRWRSVASLSLELIDKHLTSRGRPFSFCRPAAALAQCRNEKERVLGRAVTFASLPFRPVAPGGSAAPITERDVRKMAAQVFRIAPGAELATTVPEGSDGYLFLLSGSGAIAVDGRRAAS